jgi:hypothetical protein
MRCQGGQVPSPKVFLGILTSGSPGVPPGGPRGSNHKTGLEGSNWPKQGSLLARIGPKMAHFTKMGYKLEHDLVMSGIIRAFRKSGLRSWETTWSWGSFSTVISLRKYTIKPYAVIEINQSKIDPRGPIGFMTKIGYIPQNRPFSTIFGQALMISGY